MQRITRETPIRLVRDNKLLSARVCNDLLRYGSCNTVGDMLDMYLDYTLGSVKDMGYKARSLVKKFLIDYDFIDINDNVLTTNEVIEDVSNACEIASNVTEYSVTSNGMSAKILIDGDGSVDSAFLELVKLTLNQALENEKEKLKLKEFENNPLTTKLQDVRPALSTRSFNCLYRHGCKTVGDVLKLSKDDLDKVRNLGLRGKEEVIERFSKYGKFKDEE